MHPRASHALAPIAALALISPLAAAQGTVHVVDDDGGPGVDFSSLQAAVNAAVDGDVVLIRSGSYAGLTLTDKDLVLVADQGAQVTVNAAPSVTQLSAGKSVLLQGLTLRGNPGLRLANNTGAVVVDDCDVFGVQPGLWSTLPYGMQVVDCASVTVTGSTVQLAQPGFGEPALRTQNSRVFLFDSDFHGPAGAFGTYGDGSDGGPGATVAGGELFASGCRFLGGDGGDGGVSVWTSDCGDGGNGGPGLVSLAGGGTPQLTLQDSLTQAGAGGVKSAFGTPPCVDGVDGLPVAMAVGSPTVVTEEARSLSVSSPVRAGAPFTLNAGGQPGELVVLTFSAAPAPQISPLWTGVLVPEIASLGSVSLGAVPAGGDLEIAASLGLPPGAPSQVLVLQAVHLGTGGLPVAGAPATTVVLDAAL